MGTHSTDESAAAGCPGGPPGSGAAPGPRSIRRRAPPFPGEAGPERAGGRRPCFDALKSAPLCPYIPFMVNSDKECYITFMAEKLKIISLCVLNEIGKNINFYE